MRRLASVATCALTRASSAWSGVKMGPPDPILGLSVAFNQDKHPDKVNLGVGVYRGDDNKPYVLPSVRAAQQRILDLDFEYAPITGVASFVSKAQKLAFKDAKPVVEGRIASTQTLSGTGALRVAGEFLARFYGTKHIYLPKPTWGNHGAVFKDARLEIGTYSYYNPVTKGVDIENMLTDLMKLPEGSIVLLHACAHNPTGIDPTQDEWRKIAEILKQKKLFPVVDMAYQGFASGDTDRDAFAPRLIANECPSMILCQSFAKSFGLYGQRAGAMHIVCTNPEEMERVLSQIKILIRPMYSNPPLHGARIVDTVIGDSALEAQWRKELTGMADRMNGIRKTLVEELKTLGSKIDWSHITRQIGMMAFTGLNKDQVARMKAEFHIYMTDDGRMAVSGLNTHNVKYVAKCLHEVTK